MKLSRVGGAVGFVLLLGACEVHVGSEPTSAPPPPPPARNVAANTPAPPPPPPAHPAPANPGASTQSFQAHPVSIRFPARIVHPPPSDNAASGHLDVSAMKLKLRVGQKCGPRESTPGHWIHIDCNQYTPVTTAKKFSGRKLRLLLGGNLRLDSAVGHPGGQDAAGKPGAVAAQIPDAVDHRTDGTEGPIKDQGQVGSCTAFSLSSAMDNALRRQNSSDATSSLHIWSHYGYPNMANAGDGNVAKAIATWPTWPYDERLACEIDQTGDCGPFSPPTGAAGSDAQLQAKIKDSDSKGQWQISEYDEIPSDPDTVAAMLATGADVWFSMEIGSTFMTLKGDTISDWTADQVEGGHAILFSGYRHQNGQRQFLIHNSWGKDWGDGGFAYISEGMLKQFIKHAYKVVVTNKAAPPVPPSNPNALTDDDCGEDQLVDSVTGQCATMCPDDSRPANGQCVPPSSAKHPPGAPASPPPAPPPAPAPPRHIQLKPR